MIHRLFEIKTDMITVPFQFSSIGIPLLLGPLTLALHCHIPYHWVLNELGSRN